MVTLEERVSQLEIGCEHLATKTDLADLRTDLNTAFARVESRLLRWMMAMILTSTIVASLVPTLL